MKICRRKLLNGAWATKARSKKHKRNVFVTRNVNVWRWVEEKKTKKNVCWEELKENETFKKVYPCGVARLSIRLFCAWNRNEPENVHILLISLPSPPFRRSSIQLTFHNSYLGHFSRGWSCNKFKQEFSIIFSFSLFFFYLYLNSIVASEKFIFLFHVITYIMLAHCLLLLCCASAFNFAVPPEKKKYPMTMSP